MIRAEKLEKVFDDKKKGPTKAVDALSFACSPGRIYGLLGGNGAGKTTTLRLLATMLNPSAGTAVVAGFDLRMEPSKVRAQIGFLAASTALYGRLTVQETLVYFAELNGLTRQLALERIALLSERMRLTEFLEKRVDALSTGIKQRLSIARTVLHDPSVLILDEPTLGLDVMSARNIVRFVRECRDQGRTVVYSTHVMSEAEKLCDTIGIIHKGRIVAEGCLDDLRERYASRDLEDVFVKAVDGESEGTQ